MPNLRAGNKPETPMSTEVDRGNTLIIPSMDSFVVECVFDSNVSFFRQVMWVSIRVCHEIAQVVIGFQASVEISVVPWVTRSARTRPIRQENLNPCPLQGLATTTSLRPSKKPS